MQKISERALAFMVERHKREAGPSQGFASMHQYNSGTDTSYPNPTYVQPRDIMQALDEWQASPNYAFGRL